MGYESCLHLVDVRIKPELASEVRGQTSRSNAYSDDVLRFFLDRVALDSEGFLAFRASEDGLDPYVPDEEDGTVPALYGKWYEAEGIAVWLRRYSEKGGRIILHSMEADGEAWGWEFDGRGRMRALRLRPTGKWE